MVNNFTDKQEKLIGTAINFIGRPEIKEKGIDVITSFLKGKGLTQSMVDEAYKRLKEKEAPKAPEDSLEVAIANSLSTRVLMAHNIKEISSELVIKIKHIEYFIVTDSDITKIDPEIKELTNLHTLMLINCNLKSTVLSDTLADLPKLSCLCLRNNQLDDVSTLLRLPKLEHLDLDNNEISVLDTSTVDNHPTLRRLSLKNNKLSHKLSLNNPQIELILDN